MEEKTLSDKIVGVDGKNFNLPFDFVEVEDVREFIKKLKEFVREEPSVTRCGITEEFIDKLAGEKLI